MNQNARINIEKQELFTFAIILASSILLFWWRIWAPSPVDRMHFGGDILIKDYPTRLGLLRIWLQGSFPLWDPYQFGGWPGFANCEAGLFYPFNWLLLPFVNAPLAGYQVAQWTVLLHFWIAGIGAYALARFVGLAPLGAAMTAIAFTFCGFHCAHKQHTNLFYTITWFPWILLQAEQWIRNRNTKSIIYLTLLLTLAVFAGHPQASLYMTLILFARLIHGTLTHKNAPSDFFTFFQQMLPVLVALVLVIGLTAVQWVPLWELIQQGERAEADAFEQSIEFSLPPVELVDMILPEVVDSWVEVYYWGIVPLLLTLLAIRLCPLDHFFRFLFFMALIVILLSLGDYFFLFDLSYVLIPGVAWVRAPSRWIYFASLPIALLAGLAIDWLLKAKQHNELEQTSKTVRNISIGWGALLASVSIVLLMFIDDATKQRFVQTFLIQVFISAIFLAALFLYTQKKLSAFAMVFLAIGITWFDLGTHYRTLDLQPGIGGYDIDETAERIQEANWNDRTKIFLSAGSIRDKYHGAAQNFKELDGNSPLTPQLNLNLRKDTAISLPMAYNANLLNLLGTGMIVTDHESLVLPFTKVGEDLFINDKPTARARLYSDYIEADLKSQRSILMIQSFPFDRVLLRPPQLESNNKQENGVKEDESQVMTSPWLNKPFLLVSASKQAVNAKAMLIVDGKNHFADMGNEPGYYLAQADPASGEIERTLQLNLMSSAANPAHPAHVNLQEFIRTVPMGKTVFAAVSDNAANVLLAEGLSAFQQIGAKLDVRTGYQMAHAIIGRKGAPIGSAVEIVSPTEAFVLQTEDNFQVSGTAINPIDTVRYFGTTEHIKEWNNFWETVYKNNEPDNLIRFHTTDNSILPYPVRIHSVPKKTNFFDIEKEKALIEIGGKDFSSNQRGYNIVTINPETFKVDQTQNFNLLNDYDPVLNQVKNPATENVRMKEFLKSVPDGYYVLGAIKDEALDLMQAETLSVLHELGSGLSVDLTNPFERKQWSHAFIFIKGSNTFIEAFGKDQDALIVSRYPGGPMLLREDFENDNPNYNVYAPLDEWKAMLDEKDDDVHRAAPVWSVKTESPNHLVASGMSEEGGILMLNEIYYPGWTASLVGFDLPVEQVNYYFRGVEVPPGGHIVEFIFQPDSFRNGILISLISLFLLFLFINWQKQRR